MMKMNKIIIKDNRIIIRIRIVKIKIIIQTEDQSTFQCNNKNDPLD